MQKIHYLLFIVNMRVVIVVVLIMIWVFLLLFTFFLVVVVYLLIVFSISDLGEWNVYQEDLSRKRIRYQSNAYQELKNYLTTFDLGALGRGPDGNNNLLKWCAKRCTIFPVVATIAKEILVVPTSTVSVEQTLNVGGYIWMNDDVD
ncbi:hypothetical protein OROMI_031837 [Orobanche minor]